MYIPPLLTFFQVSHSYSCNDTNTRLSPQLFDLIRRERPETLRKIVPLTGDCAKIGLGFSATYRHILEETVSIVFHVAATISFDYPLKSAVLIKTRGTREIMVNAMSMKNLKVHSISVCA